jgi:hypothetical protein
MVLPNSDTNFYLKNNAHEKQLLNPSIVKYLLIIALLRVIVRIQHHFYFSIF